MNQTHESEARGPKSEVLGRKSQIANLKSPDGAMVLKMSRLDGREKNYEALKTLETRLTTRQRVYN
jgi:hypothetical protein